MAEAAYTAKDITVLEGLEPVRLRPGMYIGSTGSRGLHHLVYEVVDNAVDEALADRNDLVEVIIHPDNSVTVRDAGAGIPVDVIPEQGLPALTVVLTKLHAGGKFGGEGYKVSGGLHGVGVSVVNALSEWLVAEVRRDGKVYRQEFARGEPTTDMETVGVAKKDESGTTISFLPDPEVFEETESRRGDALAASTRDGVPHTGAAHRATRREGGRTNRRVPLRGRDQGLRGPRERGQGSRAQAHRVLRGRERRGRRRGRHAVEHVVRGVGVLVCEQHQHDGGRHASPGLPCRADADAQPVRAPGGAPEGEGRQPRGRGRSRGARGGHLREAPEPAVRGADEDEARQSGSSRPGREGRQSAAFGVPRGEPDRGSPDRPKGDRRAQCATGGAQGARAHAPQERARELVAPGQACRLHDQGSRLGGAVHRRGGLGRWLREAGPRPDYPGDPAAAREDHQLREEPHQQGPLEHGDPGDDHSDRDRLRRTSSTSPTCATAASSS